MNDEYIPGKLLGNSEFDRTFRKTDEYFQELHQGVIRKYEIHEVADYGSNSGGLAIRLLHAAKVEGYPLKIMCVDRWQEALAYAEHKAAEWNVSDCLSILQRDLCEMPAKAHTVQNGYFAWVLQYILDREPVYAALEADLVPGAYCIFADQTQNMEPLETPDPALYPNLSRLLAVAFDLMSTGWDREVGGKIPLELLRRGCWQIPEQITWRYHGVISEMSDGQRQNVFSKIEMIVKLFRKVGAFEDADLFEQEATAWANSPGAGFKTMAHIIVARYMP